jgi:hypothetical protein
MVAFSFLFVPFLVVQVGALPNQPQAHSSSRDLCGPLVSTPIGTAQGTIAIKGISRFAVRYASAQRWKNAQVATEWELPYVQSVWDSMVTIDFPVAMIHQIQPCSH